MEEQSLLSGGLVVWGIALAVAVLVGVFGVSIYNGLVRARNAVSNAFQQIDVQLQRRHDLIPNLVETAKAMMAHERETLEAVVEARNRAYAVAHDGRNEVADPAAMADRQAAEAALGGALGRFLAVAEAHPDLKADNTMRGLSEELATTENRVAFARQAYNDAVMAYNNGRESFPGMLLAGRFGFVPAQGWEVEAPTVRQAVQVSFS